MTAAAMKALNAKGIVHRDLKPQVSELARMTVHLAKFRQLKSRKAGRSGFSFTRLTLPCLGVVLSWQHCVTLLLGCSSCWLLFASLKCTLISDYPFLLISRFFSVFSFSSCLPITVTKCHATIRTYYCAIRRTRTVSPRRHRSFAWRSPISGLPVFSKKASWRLRSVAHRCTWLLKVRSICFFFCLLLGTLFLHRRLVVALFQFIDQQPTTATVDDWWLVNDGVWCAWKTTTLSPLLYPIENIVDGHRWSRALCAVTTSNYRRLTRR